MIKVEAESQKNLALSDLAARTEEITAATDTVNEISQNVREAIEVLTD